MIPVSRAMHRNRLPAAAIIRIGLGRFRAGRVARIPEGMAIRSGLDQKGPIQAIIRVRTRAS
jgi:hypothetical protein